MRVRTQLVGSAVAALGCALAVGLAAACKDGPGGAGAAAGAAAGGSGGEGGGGGGAGAGATGGGGAEAWPCTAEGSAAFLAALRERGAGTTSRLAAPGQELTAALQALRDSPEALALLPHLRASLAGADPGLAPGDAPLYQVVASRALAAALLAVVDRDAALADRAVALLETAAVEPGWLDTAAEVSIRVGGSLLALAVAAELLGAEPEFAPQHAAGLAALERAAASLAEWTRLPGNDLYLRTSLSNHNVRHGAGLLGAGLLTGAQALPDDAVALALTELAAAQAAQTDGASGWAEGPTYFGYGFEVGAPALTALDAAWPGGDEACVVCPGHEYALCSDAPVLVRRPSSDPALAGLLRAMASLETAGGFLAPLDDSRLAGVTGPLLDRLAGARLFGAWRADGPQGSLGGSVDVAPLVALALPGNAALPVELPARVWPAAGTAHLTGTTGAGTGMELFLIAEGGLARHGDGHERPDTLALVLVVDGVLALGASGYGSYPERGPLARADASSLITLDGDLPGDAGAVWPAGPEATLAQLADGAVRGAFEADGAAVSRTVRLEPSGVAVVEDVVTIDRPRTVGWHWHLRGTLDPGEPLAFVVGASRCAITQEGEPPAAARETAPTFDDYSGSPDHPVIRQLALLAAGEHRLTTRISCEPAP